MSQALRILVVPLNGHGHINACHGLCDELRDRGHEVIFVLDNEFKGKLAKYGFKEHIVPPPPKQDEDGDKEEVQFWQNFIRINADRYAEEPIKHLSGCIYDAFSAMLDQGEQIADVFGKIIDELKPDIIVYDGYVCFPAIVNAPVPWVWMFSAAPHALLNDSRLPPTYSGLPSNDKSEHESFRKSAAQALKPLLERINEFNVSHGGQPLEAGRMHPLSPYLNVYMQPQELRYSSLFECLLSKLVHFARYDDLLSEGDPIPDTIVAVDCFVRDVPDVEFVIPEQIAKGPGKLILFSMGSFGCANLKLMERLLSILAKSPNRFIVSKGPLKYDLPGTNMWGDAFLPQTAILPQVDLVITHGGNNTVTETFYYGKKMLVLPTFCDQFDNAQRIHETGLGRRVNPFKCSEQELLDAIELLVNDSELTEKMNKIGQRIRHSKDKQRVADLIENLVKRN